MDEGPRRLGLSNIVLRGMKKGAVEKALLAWLVHSRAIVSNAWLADRLMMGVGANVGKYVKSIAMSRDPRIVLLRAKLVKI